MMKTRLLIIIAFVVALGFVGIQETFAEQSSGKPIWEINSDKVCGDKLCSEIEELFTQLSTDNKTDLILFEIDGFNIFTNSPHVTNISLDWNGDKLPSGTLTFDSKVTDVIELHVPKNMPRTTNLDFGTALAVFYPDYQPFHIVETGSDCFYTISIEIKDTEKIEFDSISVAAGRWEQVTENDPKCISVYNEYLIATSSINSSQKLDEPKTFSQIMSMPSPLKQTKDGVEPWMVKCNDGLTLLLKPIESIPVCVTGDTADKLLERDWILVVSRGNSSFCDEDVFDSQDNLNMDNSTHHWNDNECEYQNNFELKINQSTFSVGNSPIISGFEPKKEFIRIMVFHEDKQMTNQKIQIIDSGFFEYDFKIQSDWPFGLYYAFVEGTPLDTRIYFNVVEP